MKKTFRFFGIIAVMAVIVFSMAGCSDGSGGSEKTKFDGSWIYRDMYGDYDIIKFTGNDFIFRRFSNGQEESNGALIGTFMYTDREITWIAPSGVTWETFTSRYLITGKTLYLNGIHGMEDRPFTKQ